MALLMGLIGSESARHFHDQGYDVWGIDNDMRSFYFGPDASNTWLRDALVKNMPRYRHFDTDIRSADEIDAIFARGGTRISAVIHAAAQPSHDWAATQPGTDFSVNANGTLNLLQAAHRHTPAAPFVFVSTNKVYGDRPNSLPLIELDQRFDLPPEHPCHAGIDADMSIDQSMHSLFGVSKTAADLLVQEFGRFYGMFTACFRGGCLTGPNHAGVRLHGFLAYLMKCALTGSLYTVYGYKGKQVRDNIHSRDFVLAVDAFVRSPKPAAVYNIGGGRFSNCSILEAIAICEEITGRPMNCNYQERHRAGDHKWWITDLGPFQADFPNWSPRHGLKDILEEIFHCNFGRWKAEAP